MVKYTLLYQLHRTPFFFFVLIKTWTQVHILSNICLITQKNPKRTWKPGSRAELLVLIGGKTFEYK